ncbi:MAG: AAA family ATPase [Eubacteriales bacterium]|nr:AAA family ATPase [Eubacteriales bacterium]
MEILEIHMKHFGKFTNQTMQFHPGINIIYGENETGKSTMRAFIRGMFFGIERMRGRAAETDEYSLRKPWENGSYFAGTMRFRSGRKVFRLERSFSKEEKEAHLICETDGEEMDIERGDLEVLLEGMDETAFDNTVFLANATGRTDEGLADAVRNEMINADMAGSDRVDVAAAMEELKDKRRALEREKKQKMAEKIEKLQEISVKIDYAEQEIEKLAAEEQELRGQLGRLQGDEQEEYEQQQAVMEWGRQEERGPVIWKAGKISMAVIAVAALAVSLVMEAWEIRAAAVAVIALACLGVRFFGSRDEMQKEEERELHQKRREQALRESYERQQAWMERRRATEPKRQRILAKLEWTANVRKEKMAAQAEMKEEYDALSRSEGEIEELEQQISAAYLAADTLEEVTLEIYGENARKINAYTSEILAQITGGKYTAVSLDENFQVRISTPQRLLSIWQVSRGTMEQIYFALRMACARFLNPGEELPVILDDAFITYDDARLESTLRWLYADGRQVLLFTCHKREQELMQKICGQ